METINGEWIMKGCDPSDPEALHSSTELISLIHTIGFLPLFSNDIPSFSVEEHVPAASWWTGDTLSDPWEWRINLSRDPSIAYGKFFNKSAGFVAKDFFPTFANYRRNGYDFDSLFEDELASYRAKKIMDVFELDDESVGCEIMSNEVKELASVDKNFQGVFTDLQMQTYLILSDFRQRKNKKGQSYGWHIALAETPETKWGRAFVTSAYSEDPKESWEKIMDVMRSHFPSAGEEQITRILGIRYPGVTATLSVKKTTAYIKKSKIGWPENILRAMEESAKKTAAKKAEQAASLAAFGLNENLNYEYGEAAAPIPPDFVLPDHLSEDQMDGLAHAISGLQEKEKEVIRLRYEEQKTWREVGVDISLSTARCQQISAKAIRKLRHPSRLVYIRQGLRGAAERKKETVTDVKSLPREEQIEKLKSVPVYECGLSVRAGNCLGRFGGLPTLGDVVALMDKDPIKLLQIRNLGRNSLEEVVKKLEEYGVDCYEARKAFDFAVDTPREEVAYLAPSIRLFNILYRNGLEKIGEVKALIETDPYAFLKLNGMGRKTLQELIDKMEEIGVDCDSLKIAAGFKKEEKGIDELGLSVRLYNILDRNGLDTVEKVTEKVKSEPFSLIRLGGMGKKAVSELIGKMEEIGVDCEGLKAEADRMWW